jgi:ArsR family transcriptional regulator
MTMATAARSAAAAPPLRIKGCSVTLAPLLSDAAAGELAAIHRALADPTRVQMLHLLKAAAEPICVCDFTAAFDLGQPTVSHHLAKLRDAGFVTSHRQGIWAFYRLRDDMPATASAALTLVP